MLFSNGAYKQIYKQRENTRFFMKQPAKVNMSSTCWNAKSVNYNMVENQKRSST